MTTGCVPICAPLLRMIDADLACRLALDVRNGAHPDDRLLLRAMLQVRKRARRKRADGPFWRCQLRAHYAQSKPLMNNEKGKVELMMCAPLCINNRPVAVVPVAPSRRRRPSRKSAALGADDGAMVRGPIQLLERASPILRHKRWHPVKGVAAQATGQDLALLNLPSRRVEILSTQIFEALLHPFFFSRLLWVVRLRP